MDYGREADARSDRERILQYALGNDDRDGDRADCRDRRRDISRYGQVMGRESERPYGHHSYGRQEHGQRRTREGERPAQSEHPSDAIDERSSAVMQEEARGKGPKGYTRSDDRIREDVCDAMTDDPLLDASEIEIEVKDGEVTLNGTVGSRQAKRHAEDIVERIGGVKHVQNNVRLKPGGSASLEAEL